jgi:hypothetical protein
MNSSISNTSTSKNVAQSLLILVMSLLSLWAVSEYPGSSAIFILYSAIAIALAWVTLRNPISFFALFFVGFLTLGCWAKLVFHFILSNHFVEPIGRFEDSPQAWDQALMVLIAAFSPMLLAGVVTQFISRPDVRPATPPKYSPLLSIALSCSVIWTIGLLIFNYYFSIIKIGTEPTLTLNSYVYVVIAFMVAWGNIILLGTLGFWMTQAKKLKPINLFLLLNIEGCLAAISMGSRAQMILHAAVPFAAYFIYQSRLGWRMRTNDWIKIVPMTLGLFIVSILAVSADRLASFATAVPVTKTNVHATTSATDNLETSTPVVQIHVEPAAASLPLQTPTMDEPEGVQSDEGIPPSSKTVSTPVIAAQSAPAVVGLSVQSVEIESPAHAVESQDLPNALPLPPEQSVMELPPVAVAPSITTDSKEMLIIRWKGVMYQLSRLVVDRWIGLEGILTMVAEPDKLGTELFQQGMNENPNLGTAALYQIMSGSMYETFENFTFMTIPGPIAILFYSGSLMIVAAGILLLYLIGNSIELLVRVLLKNPLASGTTGMAMAYLIVQTNFPKALWFFLLELVLFVGALTILKILLFARASNLPNETKTPRAL